MGSLPVLEAVCVCSNSDNALNLNHRNIFSNGAFFLSLSLCLWVCVSAYVCVCRGPRLVRLITRAYECPHCQNRAASIPLLFGSKLEQWKWVNSSELHLVSFQSHVCKFLGCMGKKRKCATASFLLWATLLFLYWTFFYFLLWLCVLFTLEICIDKAFYREEVLPELCPAGS